MLRFVKLGAVMSALIFTIGCSSDSSIDQNNLCEVNNWRHDAVAKECAPGQKVVFLPSSFGNKQLPILFAAVNCDHRYSIALTEGGVSCVYKPIVIKSTE
ncbi:MAG: hypothetical protein LBE89_07975 [Helicobacteraceae bacterium]|jgi:hypothetical protein|nr:hypothetical protein [Helicobacteraceae bacterium]